MALIAAEVLQVPVDAIDVTWGDTAEVAWDFVTDASRSVHCTGKAVYNAAQDLVRQLKALAANRLDAEPRQLEVREGNVYVRGSRRYVDIRTLGRTAPPRTAFEPFYDPATDKNPLLDESTGRVIEEPPMRLHEATRALARALAARGGVVGLGHYVFNPGVQSWGASFAEVEVDMQTGQVDVRKLVCAHDVGRVIYHAGAEAQIHGGTIMGLGYALNEELLIDPQAHVPLNLSLYELGVPTALDYPEMQSILVEAPVKAGPFGAKGLGENPMLNAAPAVGNAIANAIGAPVDHLPYSWARVYEALTKNTKT